MNGEVEYQASVLIHRDMSEDAARYMQNKLLEKVMLEGILPYAVTGNFFTGRMKLQKRPFDFTRFPPAEEVVCRLRIQETERPPVIFLPAMTALPTDTLYCAWCSGWTYNDRRGNCSACGGPRTNDWRPKW